MSKTSPFILNHIASDDNDSEIIKRFFLDIYSMVKDHMFMAYEDNIPEIKKMHPKTLMNTIASMLVVNLSRQMLIPNLGCSLREEALKETLDELSRNITFLWRAFETLGAREDIMI